MTPGHGYRLLDSLYRRKLPSSIAPDGYEIITDEAYVITETDMVSSKYHDWHPANGLIGDPVARAAQFGWSTARRKPVPDTDKTVTLSVRVPPGHYSTPIRQTPQPGDRIAMWVPLDEVQARHPLWVPEHDPNRYYVARPCRRKKTEDRRLNGRTGLRESDKRMGITAPGNRRVGPQDRRTK